MENILFRPMKENPMKIIRRPKGYNFYYPVSRTECIQHSTLVLLVQNANFLKSKGFRTPGPAGTGFAEDVEPEYAAISHDSRTAWVTLQENNAIAKIDLHSSRIEEIFALGFLNHNLLENALDASDSDGKIGDLKQWPVKGMYLPDGISSFTSFGTRFHHDGK